MTPEEMVKMKAALAAGARIKFTLPCSACAAMCVVYIKQIDEGTVTLDGPTGWVGLKHNDPGPTLCPRCLLVQAMPAGNA